MFSLPQPPWAAKQGKPWLREETSQFFPIPPYHCLLPRVPNLFLFPWPPRVGLSPGPLKPTGYGWPSCQFLRPESLKAERCSQPDHAIFQVGKPRPGGRAVCTGRERDWSTGPGPVTCQDSHRKNPIPQGSPDIAKLHSDTGLPRAGPQVLRGPD